MRYIELFAGCGGFALATALCATIAQHTLIDIDRDCCATLQANFPSAHIIHNCVSRIDYIQYQSDVLIAGFPCQPFSIAGKQLGLLDQRTAVIEHLFRAIDETQVHTVLLENVKGLKSINNGDCFSYICTELSNRFEYVSHYVFNAAEFGVPQKRERLIIVASKYKISLTSPKLPPTTLQQALHNVPPSAGQVYSAKKKAVLELVPEGGCWLNLPENIQKEYMGKSYYSSGGRRGIAKRLSWDKPCPTLTCSPSQKQTERCHPIETRPLTVREYARVQTFPDSYVFKGSISSQYKQIGNAIPVRFAQELIQQILFFLPSPLGNSF
ncbi:MAG: DNA cytosine methyltransferase [Brevinema sp.]